MVTSLSSHRRPVVLPTHSPSSSTAKEGKHFLRHSRPRLISLSLPFPNTRNRRLQLVLPNIRHLYSSSVIRYGRRAANCFFLISFIICVFLTFALTKRFGTRSKRWPRIINTSTLIFKTEDLQRIWHWEVASGHYPSRQPSLLCLSAARFRTDTLLSPRTTSVCCTTGQSRYPIPKCTSENLGRIICYMHERNRSKSDLLHKQESTTRCCLSPTTRSWKCCRHRYHHGTLRSVE